MKSIIKKGVSNKPAFGFGLTETLVALSAGTIIIGASAVALRSTETIIDSSKNKANLRQNTTNGTRLLRSEVERSLHILVNSSSPVSKEMEHTDLATGIYQKTLLSCKNLAASKSTAFKPLFGLKMSDLTQPVIYGLGVNSNGRGYSLKRCGTPLKADGRYSETEDLLFAPVVEEIGVMPCTDEKGRCDAPKGLDGNTTTSLNEIVNSLNIDFTDDKTPQRQYMEPALRLMTDVNRKLVRFIDPNNDTKDGETSYLEMQDVKRSITRQPLYFAAYARADKRLDSNGENSGVLNGAYFKNVSSKKMNFLVDGSGSMSACILWGGSQGNWRIFWSGSYYYWSRKNCSLTRMESLQHELIALLSDLPDDTRITLESFSTPGYVNHRGWSESKNGPVKLGDIGNRDSAIAFVNTLDNEEEVYRWGGTNPWDGLDKVFELSGTDTLYFLSDGEPSSNRVGGRWQARDFASTVDYYSNLNNSRATALKVNTISLGLESEWMESLSTRTTGNYLQIDKDYIAANNKP